MTARKLPPAGRPLRSFLFCELPSPRPRKWDLREVPLRGKGSRPPPEKNGEGVSFAGGSPPLPGIGEPPCRAGPVPGELENALPSKVGLAGSASPRKG